MLKINEGQGVLKDVTMWKERERDEDILERQ